MLVDSHLHIYREREIGVNAKADYPIVEYGTLEGVRYSERGGDAADALAALAEAGVSYAAVLNVFLMDGMPQPASGLVWPGVDGPPPHADRAADLAGLNEWLCDLAAQHPQLLPMLTVHPGVMTPAETADHVGSLAAERGARGVKLHTVAQRFLPSDPALDPLWELCSDRGLPVIAHCGPDRLETGWATPEAFVPLAERFPASRSCSPTSAAATSAASSRSPTPSRSCASTSPRSSRGSAARTRPRTPPPSPRWCAPSASSA